jgi:hypothetical protein
MERAEADDEKRKGLKWTRSSAAGAVRPGAGRARVPLEPVFADTLGEGEEALGVRRFDDVGVCTEAVRSINVGFFVGRRKDNDENRRQRGVITNPLENIQAENFWELQIEKHEMRQGEPLPIREFADAAQIINGNLAVFSDFHRVINASLSQSTLHEEDIVLVIFNEKYQVAIGHRVTKCLVPDKEYV